MRRLLTIAASATVVSVALAATALAGGLLGSPVPQPNTEITPVPQDGCAAGWSQWAGDVFPSTEPCGGYSQAGSPVPDTVDFFAVRFFGASDGYAAGAACLDPSTPPAGLDGCVRGPVLYHYTVVGGLGQWTQVQLPGGDKPGFIGALAYVNADDPGEVLAVGGDTSPSQSCPDTLAGCPGYPRREAPAGDPDPAGSARVWLLQNGVWRELQQSELMAGMRGLTAVDCSPRPGEGCFAGGLQQLDRFDPIRERFTHLYDNDPSQPNFTDAASFQFRVREIRFVPGSSTPAVQAVAVTAGCCESEQAPSVDALGTAQSYADCLPQAAQSNNVTCTSQPAAIDASGTNQTPRVLTFDGASWHSGILYFDPGDHTCRSLEPRQTVPDSYYALSISPGTDQLSVLATPGGPPPINPATGEPLPEPESRVTGQSPLDGGAVNSSGAEGGPNNCVQSGAVNQGFDGGLSEAIWAPYTLALGGNSYNGGSGNLGYELTHPQLSPVRLVSGDGDLSSTTIPGLGQEVSSPAPGPDGVMDWAAGAYETGQAPYQAVVYTTTQYGTLTPNPLACPGTSLTAQPTRCHPDVPGAEGQTQTHSLFSLPGYALNSLTADPNSGIVWTVGDRGAIFRLGGQDNALHPPPSPPALGQPSIVPTGDGGAYSPFQSLGTGPAGEVPSLDAQPVSVRSTPSIFSVDSPEPNPLAGHPIDQGVQTIIMSPDGSEGWALGGRPPVNASAHSTFFHFRGGTWTDCLPPGTEPPPDPACQSIAALRNYQEGTSSAPVSITAAARIPLESSSDASQDNRFEVMAIGTAYRESPSDKEILPVLVYQDGRWSIDARATAALARAGVQRGLAVPDQLVFNSPTDGWLLDQGAASSYGVIQVLHYDGSSWTNCGTDPAACADNPANPRIPVNAGGPVRLLAVGRRVYMYGARPAGSSGGLGSFTSGTSLTSGGSSASFPFIIYHDPGGTWTDADGGYDPSFDSSAAGPSQEGYVSDLTVTTGPHGYEGWAAGLFGGSAPIVSTPRSAVAALSSSGETQLLRLSGGQWTPWDKADASADYSLGTQLEDGAQIYPVSDGTFGALIAPSAGAPYPAGPLLGFREATQRWEVVPTPFPMTVNPITFDLGANVQAISGDGGGGAWLAVQSTNNTGYSPHIYFDHYTNRVPEPVFTDVAHPIRDPITSVAGGPNGSVWVGTSTSRVYKYDRITGWSTITIGGWDAGLGTSPSAVKAIAVGADGQGVIVGKQGRIADISSTAVRLDPAAGISCQHGSAPPCSSTQDLDAAAVAPDGSALVGGDDGTLLYRPEGGAFSALPGPAPAPHARIQTISMPTPDRAWLGTDSGQVLAGTRDSGGTWSWTDESVGAAGQSLTRGSHGTGLPISSVAVGSDGKGFAVGSEGLIMERVGEQAHPWHRLEAPGPYDLTSVTLAPPGSAGALIGGQDGLILTERPGGLEFARYPDAWDPVLESNVTPTIRGGIVGLVLEPGRRPGQVEAWAVEQGPTSFGERSPVPEEILHYTNDPADTLLNPSARANPLPDTPTRRPGEIVLAAFGKQECQDTGQVVCPELDGTTLSNEAISDAVVGALADGARSHSVDMALYTGDVSDAAGPAGNNQGVAGVNTPADASIAHDNWVERVAEPLLDAGLPVYGALGSQDLSEALLCNVPSPGNCNGTASSGAGLNLPWRMALSGMPAPWGAGGANGTPAPPGMALAAVPDGAATTAAVDQQGGARTHYAFDLCRSSCGSDDSKVLRVVVVDSSLRSLAAADPLQNPVQGKGGQLGWLESVLCIRGSAGESAAVPCTRPASEHAVVLSETPSYSFGPGSGSDTLTDSALFEQLMLQEHVSAVISGRLGWNGVYYTFAASVHCPQPGQAQPDPRRPPASASDCAAGAAQAQSSISTTENQLASTLVGTGAPAPPGTVLSSYPTVVAASAGGKFGPADQPTGGSASDGYWHGYSLIRLEPDGAVIVEQRPVFDWIGIEAITHALQPGQHVQLHGYGREPVGADTPIQYDDISSPAITHRYDLVEADPAEPWLPKVDSAGHYVALDSTVATIDQQSGFVKTGSGSHARVYAIAILSVGQHAATWPLVFEPSRSYSSPTPVLPQLPPLAPPLQLPAAHLAAAAPAPPPPPSSAPPTPPEVGTPSLPQLPSLTPPPPVAAVSPPVPPAPPAPPPPPSQPTPLPLALQAKLSPVGINATVVPPSPPPVNPAPPSGSAARKEAKQRQAATAKSEEGGASDQAADAAGDLTNTPPGAHGEKHMTRLAQVRPGVSITVPAERPQPSAWVPTTRPQPSAWVRDLAYGGGLGIAALVLALGFTAVRPTPRRREPPVPAPARARLRGR
jgi:hypothetical protein